MLRQSDFVRNEEPRSKLTGYQRLKECTLVEVVFWVALALDIAVHHLPIATLPHCGNVIPIWPKFSTPQVTLHGRPPSEDFSSVHTLQHLHFSPARLWDEHYKTHEGDSCRFLRLSSHWLPLFDPDRSLFDNFRHFPVQKSIPILDGKDHVAMDWPRAVGTLLYCIFRWAFTPPEGTRKRGPRKLTGNFQVTRQWIRPHAFSQNLPDWDSWDRKDSVAGCKIFQCN